MRRNVSSSPFRILHSALCTLHFPSDLCVLRGESLRLRFRGRRADYPFQSIGAIFAKVDEQSG